MVYESSLVVPRDECMQLLGSKRGVAPRIPSVLLHIPDAIRKARMSFAQYEVRQYYTTVMNSKPGRHQMRTLRHVFLYLDFNGNSS